MINFDSLTLKAFLKEIEPVLATGRVQKVQQPSRKELILNIRAQRSSHKLFISIDPRFPHVTVLSKEGELKRGIENPQKPPMFCMLLRKHMEGAKINKVIQPEHERILEIYFDSYGELGETTPLCLAIELMGKHSNIILYNCETNIILGCAHNVSSEKSREREVAGTLPYIYPPKQDKTNLLDLNRNAFYNMAKLTNKPFDAWINTNFYDISYALANEICKIAEIDTSKDKISAISEIQIKDVYDIACNILSLKHLNPSISSDYSTFSLIAMDTDINWIFVNSVNEMIDLYFAHHIAYEHISKSKSFLLEALKREIKKNKTKTSKHLKALSSDEKAEKYRQLGDIIMANLYNIKTGMESVELANPYNNNEKEMIELNPILTPNANAQRYYKLYNKTKNAAKISRQMIDELENEKNYLESVKLFVEQAERVESLEELREELESQDIIKQKQKRQKNKNKIEIDFVEIDGFKVYIGKNNKQNDYIVSKLSNSYDIWLHAQEMPGSHILIKLPPEEIEVSDETIYKAAKIAARYSQAKDSSKVPVIYTKRKYLKKPPASKPGYVTYSNEKVVIVKQFS